MKKEAKDLQTARAIEQAQTPGDDTITLSSGVVLRAKKFPPLIMIQVMAAFPRPEPPVYFNEKMGRDIENPDDPDYIERLNAWKIEYSDRMVTTMIALGTELVSVPKKMDKPEGEEWLKDYRLLGVPVHPDSTTWRYLTWIKFRGVMDPEDMKLIQGAVGRLNGIREDTVKSASSFPGSD